MPIQRQRKFIIEGSYKKTLTVEKIDHEQTEISFRAYQPATGHQLDEAPSQQVEVFVSLADTKELITELERLVAEATPFV